MRLKTPQTSLDLQGDYRVEKGWVDAYNRVRSWKVISREGKVIARVMFKADAFRIIDLLAAKEQS